jgi:mannose-6-phosphate isomerase-like protein (cupin superfamily)
MKVRQVVTGHDAAGRAVVGHDGEVEAIPVPGLGEIIPLWSADEPATYPDDGHNPASAALFPPPGGIRFVIVSYSPEYEWVAAAPVPEVCTQDGDKPGMHQTDTTDFGIILSGSVILELDDDVEVQLGAGDVVIESGTRHRWRVVGDVPLKMAVAIVGAHRR